MAAIVCSSIADLCNACSNICHVPCKACGACCESFADVFASPFLPYILVTFGLNIPPILAGIQSIMDESCWPAIQWLSINAILCAIHMIACIYIIRKIREDNVQSEQNNTSTNYVETSKMGSLGGTQTNKLEAGSFYGDIAREIIARDDTAPHSSWGRIKNVLCYDKGVALYIVVGVCWIVWQTVGVNKHFALAGGGGGGENGEDCGTANQQFTTSLFCGWLFMGLGGMGFFCSMCCMRL